MEPLPTEPNELGDLHSSEDTGLGSLAQTVRSKRLRRARIILLILGILNAFGGAGVMLAAPSLVKAAVDKEIADLRRQGLDVDPDDVKDEKTTRTRATYVAGAIVTGVGVVFIVLGLLVSRIPVAATLTALVMYVAMVVIGYVSSPQVINPCAIVLQIAITVALVNALQAAVAYQKERNAARSATKEIGM